MNRKNGIPIAALAVASLAAAGCAGLKTEQKTARHLSDSLRIYETRLDAFAKRQQDLQTARTEAIRQSRRELLQDETASLRLSAVTDAADKMATDHGKPISPAQISALLLKLHSQEDDLLDNLLTRERESASQTQQNLAALEKKKQQIEHIREHLAHMANSSSLADDDRDQKIFVEESTPRPGPRSLSAGKEAGKP